MQGLINGKNLEQVRGDIIKQEADAIVNAATSGFRGGAAAKAGLLKSAYRRSLEVADEKGLASIALPALSTGAYGYPLAEAAQTAVATVAVNLKGESSIKKGFFCPL